MGNIKVSRIASSCSHTPRMAASGSPGGRLGRRSPMQYPPERVILGGLRPCTRTPPSPSRPPAVLQASATTAARAGGARAARSGPARTLPVSGPRTTARSSVRGPFSVYRRSNEAESTDLRDRELGRKGLVDRGSVLVLVLRGKEGDALAGRIDEVDVEVSETGVTQVHRDLGICVVEASASVNELPFPGTLAVNSDIVTFGMGPVVPRTETGVPSLPLPPVKPVSVPELPSSAPDPPPAVSSSSSLSSSLAVHWSTSSCVMRHPPMSRKREQARWRDITMRNPRRQSLEKR